MMEFYARHVGIGDQDIMEADWLACWFKRHHNHLQYNHAQHRWFWK